jgi:hypothetical protein
MPERNDSESYQEERPKGGEVTLVAHQQPAEVAAPGKRPLHLPALTVAWTSHDGPPTLGLSPRAPLVGQDRRLDAPPAQSMAKLLAVMALGFQPGDGIPPGSVLAACCSELSSGQDHLAGHR